MKHVFMVQTDVQVSCQEHLDSYRSYVGKARAFMEKYAKERDAFVLDCGDIVGNTPGLYPDYIQVSGGLGLPVYRIIGNHDMEMGVRSLNIHTRPMRTILVPFIILSIVERHIILY